MPFIGFRVAGIKLCCTPRSVEPRPNISKLIHNGLFLKSVAGKLVVSVDWMVEEIVSAAACYASLTAILIPVNQLVN